MCYTVRESLFGLTWYSREQEVIRTPSFIQGEMLTYYQDGQPVQVIVDTPDWYDWLETATIFTFRNADAVFTARRERAGNRRGEFYWRAYRRHDGKLRRIYLGKSEDLTLDRLRTVADALEGSEKTDHSRVAPPRVRKTGHQVMVASTRKPRPVSHNSDAPSEQLVNPGKSDQAR